MALAGGLAGLYVAYEGTNAILLIAFRGAHYVPIEARPSLPVLGFALLLAVATGLLFGIVPAWLASRSDLAQALRGAGRWAADRSSMAQKPLVVAQVALSTVLLIGAGLVSQSLRNLEDQHFGFVTEGRLIVNIDPSLAGYMEGKLYGLYQRLEDTLPNTRRPEFQHVNLQPLGRQQLERSRVHSGETTGLPGSSAVLASRRPPLL